MNLYRIKNWDKLYENSRSRQTVNLQWVPVPNDHDSTGYAYIMAREDAAEVYAAWVLMLQVASRCSPRGTLIRGNGSPHTPSSLAVKTRAKGEWFAAAFEALSDPEIGWIERLPSPHVTEVTDHVTRVTDHVTETTGYVMEVADHVTEVNKPEKTGIKNGAVTPCHESDGSCHEGDGSCHESAVEGNRIEEKGIEGKGTLPPYTPQGGASSADSSRWEPAGKDQAPGGGREESLLELLNELKGSKYALVDSNLKIIRARLKEVAAQNLSLEDVEQMLRSRWAKWGNDPKMNEFFRPQTLFAKSKFWEYMGDRDTTSANGRPQSPHLMGWDGKGRPPQPLVSRYESLTARRGEPRPDGTLDYSSEFRTAEGKLKDQYREELETIHNHLPADYRS